MTRLELLIDQIRAARRYTEELLDATDPSDWFRMPGGVSHVAWQVGHLAMAEHRLALERIRGPRDDDEAVIPAAFIAAFGRGSTPDPDPARSPSPDAIRAVFDRVHERTIAELSALADSVLDEPLPVPHRITRTKGESLSWCARHEMIHAGQIALIRRMLGGSPLW